MRIGIITYSLSGGGSERNTINLADYFQQKGISVDIIALLNINTYNREYSDKLKKIHLITLSNDKFVSKWRFLPFGLSIFSRMFALFIRQKYDLLLVETPFYTYYITALFAAFFKIKTVFIVGNTLSKLIQKHCYIFRLLHGVFHKLALVSSTHIVCTSEGVKNDLNLTFNLSNKKVSTIYNGIDISHVVSLKKRPVPKWFRVFSKKNNLLFSFGRLDQRKNLSVILYAFKKIKLLHPKTKLIIIGKGKEQGKLETLIKKLLLQDDVLMLGFANNPYRYLTLGRVFIFSSLYEGFGLTLLEAMACGVPIVSVDCPHGPAEILSHNPLLHVKNRVKRMTFEDYGILTPPFSPPNNKYSLSQLTLAIHNLLQDEKKHEFYKKKGFERVKKFNISVMGKQYYSLIKRIN